MLRMAQQHLILPPPSMLALGAVHLGLRRCPLRCLASLRLSFLSLISWLLRPVLTRHITRYMLLVARSRHMVFFLRSQATTPSFFRCCARLYRILTSRTRGQHEEVRNG